MKNKIILLIAILLILAGTTILFIAGFEKTEAYKDAVKKWLIEEKPMPESMADIIVMDATADIEKIAAEVDFVFCAVDMKKDEIKRFLALYFDASMLGEHMPDYDGSQYFDIEKLRQEDEEDG